ncbi:MAG: cytidylyltransferase domain-containing protein [Terriglobales bacterium]
MRIVTVIQARMSSARLPGKVLRDVAGATMLARVVQRARRATLVEETLVATSLDPGDDLIVSECARLEVRCFRGDREDVLDRYYRAAQEARAEAVVRVTADNPLVDPQLIDELLRAFLQKRPDFASNGLQPTYPLGLGVEVMTMPALERAWKEASRAQERVHVTPYLSQNPGLFNVLSVTGEADHSPHRWTVDTEEDMEFARRVYAHFSDDRFGWRDVLRLVSEHPELEELNRHVRQKTPQEL